MLTIVVPLLVLVIGLVLWLAPINPKLQEIGKICFFVGLLWLVYMFSQKQIKF
jgi:Na+/phosphate symporter